MNADDSSGNDETASTEAQNYEAERLRYALQRNEIYLHIGRYVTNAAGTDSDVTTLIATLVHPAKPVIVRVLIEGRNPEEKLRLLEAVMPETWLDRKKLIKHLREINVWRNRLAHSVIGIDIKAIEQDKDLVYRFEKESLSSGSTYGVDFNELKAAEDRQALVRATLLHLVMNKFVRSGANRDNWTDSVTSFSEMLTDMHDGENSLGWPQGSEFLALAREMFPPVQR